jgi:hypothetical protein
MGSGILRMVIRSSSRTKTANDIARLCRLPRGASSKHLVICHTVGFLDRSVLSRDYGDLS